MDDQLPYNYRVDIADCEGDEGRWKVELFFKNSYYWVESRCMRQTFQRHFNNRELAYKCFYEKCKEFRQKKLA